MLREDGREFQLVRHAPGLRAVACGDESPILKKGLLQLFEPPRVFVQLRLDDVIEAAVDCSKSVMPLFAEAAEFAEKIANNRTGFRNFSPDVITLFFDEACKLVELGLLFLWHAGQYYHCDKPARAGIEFAKWRGLAGAGFAKLISRLAGALRILLRQGSSGDQRRCAIAWASPECVRIVRITVVPHCTQVWVMSSRSSDPKPFSNSAGATAVIAIRCPQC
jgi:hypothetical protein